MNRYIQVSLLVEGQTEEAFVNQVLWPHLAPKGIFLTPTLATTKRASGKGPAHMGGIVSYGKVKNDVKRLLGDRKALLVTTMIDFYGLKGKDFPGYITLPTTKSPQDQVAHLEREFKADIGHSKFVPYLALHEFEAMLFVDPGAIMQRFPGVSKKTKEELLNIRSKFKTPEDIDHDKPPSVRIRALIPQYNKVSQGPLIAKAIGLDRMRAECQHFNEWLTRLENL